MLLFSSNFRFNYNIYRQKYINNSNHPLIILLSLLYITIIFFCVLTFCEIAKYKDQSFLYLDTILRRVSYIYLNYTFNYIINFIFLIHSIRPI